MAESSGIQRIHMKVTAENLERDLKELCRKVHPEWKEEDFAYEKLCGGLLNEIYKCYVQELPEDGLVVRIYTSQDVCDLVNRTNEIIGMQVGHTAGVSEPLHLIFDNGLVYGYAPGKTVNWGMFWNNHIARKYLGSIAQFHMTDPADIVVVGPQATPISVDRSKSQGLLQRMRNVIKDIPEDYKNFPERAERMKSVWGKERFLEEIDLLEKHFAKFQMNITFCHNDVWVNNVVFDRETDRLSLLDFEYCDYNYEAFDVGILFNCFELFDAYREFFPDNIMKPADEEITLPRTEGHRKKLVKFYMQEKCRYLAKDSKEYSEQEFSNFYIQAQMLCTVTHLYWALFGFNQSDDPTVTWNLFGASENSFHMYCEQRDRLFQYEPC